jgi:hypothetical protein
MISQGLLSPRFALCGMTGKQMLKQAELRTATKIQSDAEGRDRLAFASAFSNSRKRLQGRVDAFEQLDNTIYLEIPTPEFADNKEKDERYCKHHP